MKVVSWLFERYKGFKNYLKTIIKEADEKECTIKINILIISFEINMKWRK